MEMAPATGQREKIFVGSGIWVICEGVHVGLATAGEFLVAENVSCEKSE